MDYGAKRKFETPGSPISKKKKQDDDFIDDDMDDDEARESAEPINDTDDSMGESNWARPPVDFDELAKEKLVFQKLEIDYTVGDPIPGMPGSQVGPVPIVRIFGVTEKGNSVNCNVHGFTPYFYIPAPPNFSPSDIETFRTALNRRMEQTSHGSQTIKTFVHQVEAVQKESLMGYSGGKKRTFLKIFLALPKLVPTARSILESGFNYGTGDKTYTTFESNIPFVLRCMIDIHLNGASWIEIPAGKWNYSKERSTTGKSESTNKLSSGTHKSTCQIEVDASFEGLICHAPEGEWGKLAPFRILSFDIECAGRKGVFPEPDQDPVIQIANLVTVQGEKKPMVRNVFVLGACSNIVGAQVLSFHTEKEMFLEWQKFIREVDPDVIIGYNIANFDFPYLIERAKKLKIESFLYLGRIRGTKARVKDTTFSSKAYGRRETKETTLDGRVQLDILQVIQREHKLRSYSLNSVAAHFLQEQKEEVHHSIITDLFHGSDDDRRRLAVYCLKDAYLPQRLLEKLMLMYNYVEMARVTGVPLSYLLSRGQQIKVVSQLYRKSLQEEMIIPCYKVASGDDGESYSGATVIPPKKGYYDVPIATLDFSSLYPSIMMAHNLCYTTLVRKNDIAQLKTDDYEITPNGDCFIRSSVRKGLLPKILEELLDARKRAKDDLKNEKDPFKRAVLDGRQLALKISANSVYGFTGATVGRLPCIEISASVTAYGRQMIEATKQHVEEHFSIKNGFSHDAVVIYGDTDSVMVRFNLKTMDETMKIAKEAAAYITTKFPKPIKLEFEKVYFPYLLINKKRYAGLLWTKPENYDKIDAKGIETVRRDNCPLVKDVIGSCLKKILIDRDIEGAKNYVKHVISELLQNKLDLSLLVISKALSKDGSQYVAKQAHVELAERMRKRDAHSAPAIGDRVPYVIIKAPKGTKAYEKAEDPLWVLDQNIPLDYQYYLDQQLKNPLLRLFEPIMDNPEALLVGAHTRTIALPTPKQGGIVGFAVKKLSCIGCKAPLGPNQKTVCGNCVEKEPDLFQAQLEVVSNFEKQFSAVWTQCQNCQGSMHQTVLCTSRDCPIFYKRKKVQKDLNDAQEMLERFDLSW